MIAMPASQIGWPGGQFPRRNGVATMLEKVALQLQEGVLELDLLAHLTGFERWHGCAIFRCSGLVLCAGRWAWHGCCAGACAIFWRWGLPCSSLLETHLGPTCSDGSWPLSA